MKYLKQFTKIQNSKGEEQPFRIRKKILKN